MKLKHIFLSAWLAAFLFGLTGCSHLDKIPSDRPITPEAFCDIQPCVALGSWTLTQPTSSFLVYFLGICTIVLAFVFYKNRAKQKTQFWWAISLLLGGIGTILAGTSFQAFGYEIKCAGRGFCAATSWWEVGFLVLNVLGGNAMLVAIAYSSAQGFLRRIMFCYAAITSVAYVVLTLFGVYFSIPFFLSFDLLICFSVPMVLFFLAFNAWQYLQKQRRQDLVLIGNWLLLIITMTAFYGYSMAGFTSDLWANGYWFSDNDMLHLGMLIWVIYIGLFVQKEVQDKFSS